MKRPKIIEFSGLPNSGKTTLLNNLSRLFEKNNVGVQIIQEPAELLPQIIPKGSIEQNLWITLETLQKSIENLFSSDIEFLLLDRGFYNQLFWATMYEEENLKYSEYVTAFMKEFAEMFDILPDWLYIVDVDVSESIRRREALGSPITFSKKDFLINYREKFRRFTENIESKLYIDTTNLSKNEVADIVFKQIITL